MEISPLEEAEKRLTAMFWFCAGLEVGHEQAFELRGQRKIKPTVQEFRELWERENATLNKI
jgi:hypothetical protein